MTIGSLASKRYCAVFDAFSIKEGNSRIYAFDFDVAEFRALSLNVFILTTMNVK